MSDTSETHYDVLSVEPDAPRDEIRDAYRSHVAELGPEVWKGSADNRRERSAKVNKAWNVLSDPFQRQRYDDELRRAAGQPEADHEAEEDEPAATAARATVRGRGARARQAASAKPPLVYENGLVAASNRARVNALSIDLAVIIVLVLVLNFAAIPLRSKVIEVSVNGKVVRVVEVKGRDVKALDAKLQGEERAKHTKDKTPPKIKTKKAKALIGRLLIGVTFTSLVLALATVVPMTALTGQTLGKRVSKIKLVRVDGSPPGWSASIAHYGFPIALGLLLQPYGALLAIGIVGWFAADKRRQGVHDKLARTLVVEA